MEEYRSAQEESRLSKLVFLKVGLIEVFFVTVILLSLFGLLNYFNILSVSDAFPKQFGWLPRQQSSETISQCKPFLKVSAKISCQSAVKTALTDTGGQLENIAIGPLQLDPTLKKTLQRQNLTILDQQVWLVDIGLTRPFTAHNGKVVKLLRIQIPTNGTKLIFREPINL